MYPELSDWISINLKRHLLNQQENGILNLNKKNRLYIEQALLYISQYPNKEKIKNISVKYAYKGFLKLKKQQDAVENVIKIIEFKNGYYWTQLKTIKDFYREAILMNNCLVTKIHDNHLTYFSLRNADHKSIINISIDFKQNTVIELKEKNNRDLSESNQIYVIAFVRFYNLTQVKNGFFTKFLINLKLNRIIKKTI
jgi:hypothetical protein